MPAIGETLVDRYRIDAPLGAGGMATVHRARDLRLERDVAIKVLLPHIAANRVLAQRFDREARALAAIRHPNVVAVFDVEPGDASAGREPFFVMELCEGGSLAERLAQAGGRLPPDEVIPLISGVADGLDAIHASGLLHRDVKPHNVLLAVDRPRLGDLGLARAGDAAEWESLTSTGTALGTLAYLAPERLVGDPATPAADVWALGALTYQALTGRLPRSAGTVAELADQRDDPPRAASQVQPDLGTSFDNVLGAALNPDPAARPTALAFGAGLATALGRWSREGRAIAKSAASAWDTDASQATTAAIPTPRREARSTPTEHPSIRPTTLAAAGLLAATILVAAVVAAGGLGGLGAATSSPSAGAPAASILPSAASPSPNPSASTSPSPVLTPAPPSTDPLADARQRLTDVQSAIQGAKGGGGLKGKEANELRAIADRVGRALTEGDFQEAAARADELVRAVQEDIDKHRVGGDAANRLLTAARALRTAVRALG